MVQVQLVGLSVVETARKLKATRNDGLYDAFVREFLPDGGGGRSGAGARNARVRYHLDCDVLAKKGNFEHLLGKVETVRALLCCMMVSMTCGYRGVYKQEGAACRATARGCLMSASASWWRRAYATTSTKTPTSRPGRGAAGRRACASASE